MTTSAPPAPTARSPWQLAVIVIVSFVASMYVVEAADVACRSCLDSQGVSPRSVEGLRGVLFAPVLHAGWGHLWANTVPLLVFGFLILLGGVGRWVGVTALVWLVGGVGTWLVGSPGVHLGASVLVFGWFGYLVVRGVFARSLWQVLVGLVLVVLYGSLLWGVLPGTPGISWEGHLFGLLGGVLAGWSFGRRDAAELAR